MEHMLGTPRNRRGPCEAEQAASLLPVTQAGSQAPVQIPGPVHMLCKGIYYITVVVGGKNSGKNRVPPGRERLNKCVELLMRH